MPTSYNLLKKIESVYDGHGIAISHDGRLLATSEGSRVYLIALDEGSVFPIKTFSIALDSLSESDSDDNLVLSLAFDPANPFLYAATRGAHCYQFHLEKGNLLNSWKAHDAGIHCIQVPLHGNYVATASGDGSIKIWQPSNVTLLHTLKGHYSVIRALAVSQNGNQIYSGSEDGAIRIWDATKGTCLAVCKGAHTSTVTGLALSPCGRYLSSVSRDQLAVLWDLASNKVERTFPVFESVNATCMVPFSSTDWGLWTAGPSGTLHLWNPRQGALLSKYSWPLLKDCSSNTAVLALLHYCRDNTHYIVAAYSDHNVIILKGPSDALQISQEVIGHNEEITDMLFLSDSIIAVCTNSPQLRIYDVNAGKSALVAGHSDTILCISALSSDNYFVSGCKDRTAIVWQYLPNSADLSFSVIISGRLSGHADPISAVAIGHDENGNLSVATGSQDCTIKMWYRNGPSWTAQYTIKAHTKDINSLDLSSKMLLSASQDKTAKIWQRHSGTPVATLSGHKRAVFCARFSDSGIFTSSADTTIRLWSLSDFTCIRTFEGHLSSVLKVIPLSPIEFISCGADGLVKVWQVLTAECSDTLDGHQDKVWALAVAPNQNLLVSGGADAVLNLWQNTTELLAYEANQARMDALLSEQHFSDAVAKKDYANALALSFAKKHPFRLLSLLHEILLLKHQKFSETKLDELIYFDPNVDHLFKKLSKEDLSILLSFLKDWNTSFRNYNVCQTLLSLILRHYSADIILSDPSNRQAFLAIQSYTERFFHRIDESLIQLRLLDLFIRDSS